MRNAHAVAKHDAKLTPEERFRLIRAAGACGDDAERGRLVNFGQRIPPSMPDQARYARAFEELALVIFLELLEEAARYLAAFARADDVHPLFGDDDEEDADEGECKKHKRPKEQRPKRSKEQRPKRPTRKNRRKSPPAPDPSGSGILTWPWPPAWCCGRKPLPDRIPLCRYAVALQAIETGKRTAPIERQPRIRKRRSQEVKP